jgi:CRP/FNR family nitrogen fixation transcriptional regulator
LLGHAYHYVPILPEERAMLTQIAIRVTPSTSRGPHVGGHEHHGASESNNPLVESMHLMGPVLSYKRNTEIFGEDEPADYIYKVISGSVSTYKILSDGPRQICGFYLPGDFFGLQFNDEHTFSAEAITDAKVLG